MDNDELLLIADIIDKHINIRNKDRKSISSMLKKHNINGKLDDHLKNPKRLTLGELFLISEILDISLDYIKWNVINFRKHKINLYGKYRVYRMNENEHNKANKIIIDKIKELHLYPVNEIIDEIKKFYKKGYIIDALLPIYSIKNNKYEIYYNESRKRGEIREGIFNVYPAYPYNVKEVPDCQQEYQFLQKIIKEILERRNLND